MNKVNFMSCQISLKGDEQHHLRLHFKHMKNYYQQAMTTHMGYDPFIYIYIYISRIKKQ